MIYKYDDVDLGVDGKAVWWAEELIVHRASRSRNQEVCMRVDEAPQWTNESCHIGEV